MECKVKRATRNYVCEDCGGIIEAGRDYFDTWHRNENGQFFHKRYCLSCRNLKNTNFDLYHRILEKLEKEGAFPVGKDDIKYWVQGISFTESGKRYIQVTSWDRTQCFYESVEDFGKNYHNDKGEWF